MLRYLDLFLQESREHLDAAFEVQGKLGARPTDPALRRELLRHAHSLKGMAATMGYDSIVALAHATEDLLQELDEAATIEPLLPLLGESVGCLGRLVDLVERGEEPVCREASRLTRALRGGATDTTGGGAADGRFRGAGPCTREEPQPGETCWGIELALEGEAAPSAAGTVETLRGLGSLGRVVHADPPLLSTRTGRFEGRLRLTLSTRLSRQELQNELERLAPGSGFSLRAERAPAGTATGPNAPVRWVRVRTEQLEDLVEGVLELRLEYGRLKAEMPNITRSVRQHLERSEFRLKEIYGTLMELRLVPFDSVARRLHQSVRDLARELGKEIDFQITGGEVRIDRLLLDALVDPLLHMVRNALDHGIEPAAKRRELGKPARGTIRVALRRLGDRVQVSVEDDGRGISVAEVRRTAVERGLIEAVRAERMSENDVLMLITLPGFSTAKNVSHVSGRGVGLDVVTDRLKELGGSLEVHSERNRGTELSLSLSASQALIQTLRVRCAGELYVVPVERLTKTVKLGRLGLERGMRGESVETPEGRVELVRLDQRLGLRPWSSPFPEDAWALLLDVGQRRVGLVVDEVLGREEALVHPLQPPLSRLAAYGGGAVMEDGSIALVLNPLHLAAETS